MRRSDLISKKLDDALTYLEEQDRKLSPHLNALSDLLIKKIHEEELSAQEVFKMYIGLQQQYTDTILLITKIKEIIDYHE